MQIPAPTRAKGTPTCKAKDIPSRVTVVWLSEITLVSPRGAVSRGAATAAAPRSVVTGTMVCPRGVAITIWAGVRAITSAQSITCPPVALA